MRPTTVFIAFASFACTSVLAAPTPIRISARNVEKVLVRDEQASNAVLRDDVKFVHAPHRRSLDTYVSRHLFPSGT